MQRVRAVGKPPTDVPCLFAHLKNVVVMPSVGEYDSSRPNYNPDSLLSGPRSLASCLGGGDVDGLVDSIQTLIGTNSLVSAIFFL